MRTTLPALQRSIPLLLLVLWLAPLCAQESGTPAPPLERFLNPDGTLNLESGFSGGIDPSGWSLRLDAEGAPRFVPAALPADSIDTTKSFGSWDDRFGPPGPNGVIYAVAVLGDNVYVGGRFNTIGGINAYNIAAWNRSARTWSGLREGVSGPVHALLAHGGRLYVGGTFARAGSSSASGIAVWNPDSLQWSELGGGLSHAVAISVLRGGDVYAIAAIGSDIYVGGDFFATDNPAIRNFAKWDGTRWLPGASVRPNGVIYTMKGHGTSLYVGGSFSRVGVEASNIAVLNTASGTWALLGAGVRDTVRAIAARGNDIYVGGAFTMAGDVAVNRIARWDGARWNRIGMGVDATVYAIALDGANDIYLGGQFTTTFGLSSNCIVKWNGGSWSMLGSGMGLSANGATQWIGATIATIRLENADRGPIDIPFVRTIAIAGDEVFAGGHFTSAGNTTTHHVAVWRGGGWDALADGLTDLPNRNGADGAVHALAVDGDKLYIGGDFSSVGGVPANRVARWNGATHTWEGLGNGVTGPTALVRALAFNRGMLYVGGVFDSAGSLPARGLARWDGVNWAPVGGGVGGDNPFVFALAVEGSGLYVGGAFTRVGGIEARSIARFDLAVGTWSAIGEGIDNETTSAYVTAIAARGNNLYVGGGFTRAGNQRANNIARWDGSRWHSLGTGLDNGVDAPVRAIAIESDSTLFIGGEFRLAGRAEAGYLAYWNGGEWSGPADTPNAPIHALHLDDGDLYIAGEFTQAGDAPMRHLARWDGSTWNAVGGRGVEGINGFIHALAPAGEDLYLGGEFTATGGIYTRNIARIADGHPSALGSDARNGLYGMVTAIAVRGSDVYVGGAFVVAGGMRTGPLARWDGRQWLPVGPELDGPVRAIAIDSSGMIYVGGEFGRAGDLEVNGVARWDGAKWSSLGSGMGGARPYVYALAINGGYLYAGGAFASAGGIRTSRVARWNIASQGWSTMSGGVNGANYFTYVNSIVAYGTDVYVGGVFPAAGAVRSENLVRWDGSAWQSVGGGVNNSIYTLAVNRRGELYVGGDFRAAGETEARYLARWDGARWTNISGLRRPVHAVAFNGDEVIVGTSYGFNFELVTDFILRWNGAVWQQLGPGAFMDFDHGIIMTLVTAGSEIYVGGEFSVIGGRSSYGFGLWHASTPASAPPLRASGHEDVSIAIAGHPNPASDMTTIDFILPRSGDLRLALFDAYGRELRAVDVRRYAAGRHSVRCNLDGVPSGVYLCRIECGGLAATTKVIVIHD